MPIFPLRSICAVSERDPLARETAPTDYAHGAVWDEFVTGDGRIRAHWQPLMGHLAQFEPADLAEMRDEATRLLRQTGVGYTIYADPRAVDRTWPLDLIPLLIPADEWRAIAAGAAQRARLLDAILADLYGAQRLLADGLLPPSLLFANPSFLRPCVGIAPRSQRFLHLYAVDLARSPDGRWWVLSDRTQAPSGAGYALENRSVVGRVLEDCLDPTAVAPVAPFFSTLRENLGAAAPRDMAGRPPRVVLLTPGIYNETYFEHAYLARRLDITLVEGADLTVRDRRVFLKTLGGLEPVDVILRRLDDDFCDPLELRQDSTLGVAGLVEAVRGGHVAIANALGSGLLEGMAFKPFLPGICQALLGETLTLPDVASWWCGGAQERQYVADHIDRLVIKPSFPALGFEPIFGAELSREERQSLLVHIAERPLEFVGQERVELSTAPVFAEGRLVPRPLVLRVFVAADGEDFAVMPGGFTRTAPVSDRLIVSMQQGGGCKDTWVIGGPKRGAPPAEAASAKVVSLRPASVERSSAASLPSRAADGLFWVGRYSERVSGGARLLRTLRIAVTNAAKLRTEPEIEPAVAFVAALGLMPAFAPPGEPPSASGVASLIRAAIVDESHPNGIPANLRRLNNAARGVGERLPQACWQIVAALAGKAAAGGGQSSARLLQRLDDVITLCDAFWGVVNEFMERDAGWRFLDLGKRLERAIDLVAILRAASRMARSGDGEARRFDDATLLSAALTAVGARPVPGAADARHDVAAALSAALLRATDPLSVGFQLATIAAHLGALPQAGRGPGGEPPGAAQSLALVQAAQAALAAGAERAMRDAGAGPLAALHDTLTPLSGLLPELSNALARAYFTHAFARPA